MILCNLGKDATFQLFLLITVALDIFIGNQVKQKQDSII
jgi:hypothetical protein